MQIGLVQVERGCIDVAGLVEAAKELGEIGRGAANAPDRTWMGSFVSLASLSRYSKRTKLTAERVPSSNLVIAVFRTESQLARTRVTARLLQPNGQSTTILERTPRRL